MNILEKMRRSAQAQEDSNWEAKVSYHEQQRKFNEGLFPNPGDPRRAANFGERTYQYDSLAMMGAILDQLYIIAKNTTPKPGGKS